MKALDMDRHELTAGARVVDALNPDFTARVTGFRTIKSGERVDVRLLTPVAHAGKQATYPVSPDRTCDLLLLHDKREAHQ